MIGTSLMKELTAGGGVLFSCNSKTQVEFIVIRKLSWRLGEITHNPLHHNLKAILTDTFECRNI